MKLINYEVRANFHERETLREDLNAFIVDDSVLMIVASEHHYLSILQNVRDFGTFVVKDVGNLLFCIDRQYCQQYCLNDFMIKAQMLNVVVMFGTDGLYLFTDKCREDEMSKLFDAELEDYIVAPHDQNIFDSEHADKIIVHRTEI